MRTKKTFVTDDPIRIDGPANVADRSQGFKMIHMLHAT